MHIKRVHVCNVPASLGRLCVRFPPEGSRLSHVRLHWCGKIIHTPFNRVLYGHITHGHTGRVKYRIVPHPASPSRLDLWTPSNPCTGAFHRHRGWCWTHSRNWRITGSRSIRPFIPWSSVHSVVRRFKKWKLFKVNRFHWRFRFSGALLWALEPIRRVPSLGRTPLTCPRRRVVLKRVPVIGNFSTVDFQARGLGDWFGYCDTGSAPGSYTASNMWWGWIRLSWNELKSGGLLWKI